jgi:hypothetical protein
MPSPHLQVFLRIFFAVFDRGSGKVEEALGKSAGFRQDGEIPSITWRSITAALTGGCFFFWGGLNPANIGSDLFC